MLLAGVAEFERFPEHDHVRQAATAELHRPAPASAMLADLCNPFLSTSLESQS